jgi:hypothetical protein
MTDANIISTLDDFSAEAQKNYVDMMNQQQRAAFAAAALSGLVRASYVDRGGWRSDPAEMAQLAWKCADAMMAAEGGGK